MKEQRKKERLTTSKKQKKQNKVHVNTRLWFDLEVDVDVDFEKKKSMSLKMDVAYIMSNMMEKRFLFILSDLFYNRGKVV